MAKMASFKRLFESNKQLSENGNPALVKPITRQTMAGKMEIRWVTREI